MDPLSVSASIVGILGAAAKVSSVLITFVGNAKAAPRLAQAVLTDVNGLSTVLGHLQTYLLGTTSPTRSRASLILVKQVLVTLAECVTTFSELEDVLGTSKHDAEMDTLNRIKWATKDSKVADIQRRLQSNKSSLTLMLTILQCKSMEDAESAMTRLCELVEQVLASNRDMSRRLRNMDDKPVHIPHSPNPDLEDDASTSSSRTGTPPPPGLHPDDLPDNAQRKGFGFAFEEDLFASRVYRKPLFNDSRLPLSTSAATDNFFYSIPEDGSPVTIPIGKGGNSRTQANESQTSLLIEYCEDGKVRAKVSPSAARTITNTSGHIRVTAKDSRNTRRISLGPQTRTTASSILSSLSLNDVSDISNLAVPVYADEISNQAQYTWRGFSGESS